MHSVSRRVKQTRWQPYTQPQAYLVTPATASTASPLPTFPDRKPTPKAIASIALIERAVSSLGDTWPEGEAQTLFSVMPVIQAQSSTGSCQKQSNPQLPSPISSSSSFSEIPPPPTNDSCMPLRTFVHELLRRSRTSLAILQTALCYLEAARVHVPSLRAAKATFADTPISTISISPDHPVASTSKCQDEIEALPILPHPLLCARRTFLASLLLAHKFTADKAFSNKAWARLAGLPPREVGRCERALGAVLGWRLWVGKPAEEPRTAALSRWPSAPTNVFAQEQVPYSQRLLRRVATEPSLEFTQTCVEDGQRTVRACEEDHTFECNDADDVSTMSTPSLSPASSTSSHSSGLSDGIPDFSYGSGPSWSTPSDAEFDKLQHPPNFLIRDSVWMPS